MPREGVFVRILKGGTIKNGDKIVVLLKVKTLINSTHGKGVNRSIGYGKTC
jgi:MOSC domain-containing protein YiiM